ncbi:alcohol dehydrogenase [Cryptococcus deuterogattii 99/473]|uniref:Unplaced genomic scaffold supercont1.15, whole genome shotgun sequence n=1 Tax=Cryptococcus deuterogattii Ram5 TaxID=1296110 RepID=A0A0D0UTI6_9TREE|nr:alcohol dehydrogenase [Cryptococcus deuterogattii LA55]KIR38521.1 alcohol dehydrogenase [Cryptococcus deuterogattii Ram5]KIR90286.1 alcohol dehydrogenase [Cryptococcus deuterogattii CBS 10090]KIY55141.1 alcohol dehydrogenase [Cryptococcus deuterogattii 99/473]
MSVTQLPETMDAIVFKQPYKVAVEQIPTPKLQSEGDVIIKVHFAGLCGKCYYCSTFHTSRCTSSALFGTPSLPGCQATYVRVPLAASCLLLKPPQLPEELMLLMADILPTGYSAAWNAWRLLDWGEERGGKGERKGICVVVGCGPVGLCAITSAQALFSKVFAVDPVPARRELAVKHGATALAPGELNPAIMAVTEGRGADAVLEVVGNQGALDTALSIVRPYGAVSSVGVHSGELKIDGGLLYDKNVRLQFGRCSVRHFYPAALEVLVSNQDLFMSFIEHKVNFSQAEEYYTLFEQGKVSKTVFIPGQ